MKISQFATYINPLIKQLKKLGGSARPDEVCTAIADELQLPDEVLEEQLKNGVSRFENQVHWARFYLAKLDYIDSSKRGVWTLTEKGRNVEEFSEDELKEIIQKVQEIATSKKDEEPKKKESIDEDEDFAPDPEIDGASYKEELLTVLKNLPPEGFERLCQRLLRESGFEKVQVTKRTGDGGIDGHGG